MAFMAPEYTNEEFVIAEDPFGESYAIPRSDFHTFGDHQMTEIVKGKWWCRLSADGYMDCTEWDGPFVTLGEAEQHIEHTFDVDPITGDELED